MNNSISTMIGSDNRRWRAHFMKVFLLAPVIAFSGCLSLTTDPIARSPRSDASYGSASRRDFGSSWETERLRRVVVPLIQAMDRPCQLNELRVGIVRQNEVNAATAGHCQFYVTTALLQRASDDQLRGVMAHEIAHEDLGHVAKAQVLGAGLNAGVALFERLLPGSSALTPLAGTLIARSYGRSEEYAADRHAIEILSRAGYSKAIMVDTLSWIRRAGGDHGGGFLSTHPALDDRIAALRRFA